MCFYSSMSDFEEKVREVLADPKNQGEMEHADSVGTVGSPDCGDMLRMWLKFKEQDGKKVIDKASFQSFGCQTAIAVASMATEMLKGKFVEEAAHLTAHDRTGRRGEQTEITQRYGQLVEGALKNALDVPSEETEQANDSPAPDTLSKNMNSSNQKKIKIVKIED